MKGFLRACIVTLVLVGALSAGHFARPGSAAACACTVPEAGAQAVTARTVGAGRVTGGPSGVQPGAAAPPDLGLVAIALVTFVVGLTGAAGVLAISRRREPPSDDPP